MEATATWAEDEVFPDINDNLQYLRHGPLRRPHVPLDEFETGGLHQYGDWIFFRYLTEQLPDGDVMPDLVRQMWGRADGSAGARDMYSMQAVRATLAARGESWARRFAQSPSPTAARPTPTTRATSTRPPRSAAAAPSSQARARAGSPASSTT